MQQVLFWKGGPMAHWVTNCRTKHHSVILTIMKKSMFVKPVQQFGYGLSTWYHLVKILNQQTIQYQNCKTATCIGHHSFTLSDIIYLSFGDREMTKAEYIIWNRYWREYETFLICNHYSQKQFVLIDIIYCWFVVIA